MLLKGRVIQSSFDSLIEISILKLNNLIIQLWPGLHYLSTFQKGYKYCIKLLYFYILIYFAMDREQLVFFPQILGVDGNVIQIRCKNNEGQLAASPPDWSILIELHWLPVKSKIEFKILILTLKAYYETGPKYLTDSIIKHMPSRKLRSANKELLVVPKYNLETYGKHAFQ